MFNCKKRYLFKKKQPLFKVQIKIFVTSILFCGQFIFYSKRLTSLVLTQSVTWSEFYVKTVNLTLMPDAVLKIRLSYCSAATFFAFIHLNT